MDTTVVVLIVLAVTVLAIGLAFALRRRRPPAPSAPSTASAEVDYARGLGRGLAKSRRALAGRLTSIGRERLDESFWAGVEEALIASDVGVEAASALVGAVRARSPSDEGETRAMLVDEISSLMAGRSRELTITGHPGVILVVGVNGGGKTTSVAKLASSLRRSGTSVLLGAADTFRAAARGQLQSWAERVGVDVVGGQAGADPAAVAFDAHAAARARGIDVLIVDTAGRLHSKTNLMEELSKVARVLRREAGDIGEILLVVDGTTGQNAAVQARLFSEAVGVTGIVITKLDGTARGGVVVAIERDLDVPVKFIGVGEGIGDLVPFHPHEFAEALVGT